jgi:hypothetical protein
MKKRKTVNIPVPSEIYVNFLPSGTVIDRPGLPLLKIIDAVQLVDGKVSVAVEISPTPYTKKKGD